MAFDAAPRIPDRREPSPPRELREPMDWGDFALRAVVLLPMLGFYTWWVLGLMRELADAFVARFIS